MLPPLDLSLDQQRAVVLLAPFIAAGIAILIVQPNKRMLAGIFLASIWNFVMLFPANLLATYMKWWKFGGDTHLLLGLPFDVLLGWSVWWGAFLFLAFKGKHIGLALLSALWLDFLIMPRMSPLATLGHDWLWGEALVLTTCFIPGWLLAAFTSKDIHVGWRSAAQAIMTGFLLIALLPAVLLEYFDRSLWEIFQKPAWQLSIILNLLLLPLVLGLAANQEFAERGRGTPIPFDPPKYLVVTGPYAYVANPMQVSIFLILVILGIGYQSLTVTGAALVAVIYNLGVVRWHHAIDMEPRFGKEWLEYKRNVREWIPRWKPWIREPSAVFFARDCNICQDTERWLRRLNPVGLHIADAAHHPDLLDRVTYRYHDGSEVRGLYAIASCLNHINFGFAFLGWFMRLPIIRHFLQLLIDGTGERAPVCEERRFRG
jgi:protein-S-isoprenylcysteine O-methyltransferase Ste14